jgi:hypothetical protein
VPVPEDPLAVLSSGTEDGVSALAGDTVVCGVTVAGAGVCTTKSEHNVCVWCVRELST